MPDQHLDLSFLATSAPMYTGTQIQNHHETSAQLGVGQADTYLGTRRCNAPFKPFDFDHGAHPVNDKTVYPSHSGEPHLSFPSYSVR